jgi:dTDP-4-dehydrorhamnose 3,5-epimerase
MIFTATGLAGSYVIDPEPLQDERGWFARFYCKTEFAAIGHQKEWVQMNHSFTREKGALRGMHYQRPPFREIKLVRCIAGSVYDVIVDLRAGSASFLQCFGVGLSAQNKKMLYIPEGFAHGFQALSENTELIYLHSEFYTQGAEDGLRFDDPMLQIRWPLPITVISERDATHPYLTDNFKGI